MKMKADKKVRKKINWFPYLMTFPAVFLFLLFVIIPFFEGLYTSFYKWDGFSEMSWVGIKNYINVIKDDVFWLSMKNTFIYALFVTVLKNIIALALAHVLVKKFPLRTMFRTGIYMPVTLSYVVIGVLWSWIYNPTFGLLNALLKALGLESWIAGWLSDSSVALYSVIAVDVWKWIGYHMVLYLAGLQAISQDLYEAAALDGAGGIQKFIHITVPQLNSTIIVNVLMSITGAFASNYDIVNVMTGGGPMHATEVSLTYIMTTAFKYSNMGKANAMSMILFLFVFVFGFIQLRVMTREDVYE
jgi:ABC-type sugar transport system permease subunit